jgi:hypothetical protein
LQLAADIVDLVQKYCGLEEDAAELLARFFFADWVMDALPVAPSLVIVGPESREVMQLLALTKCLSRHALLLTEATARNLRSLPTALGLTLAIDQPELKKDLKHLLNASRKSAMKIPVHRSLWSPCFSKVIHCADQFQASWIQGPKLVVAPNSHPVPLLNDTVQARIAGDFQPRMLSFRFDNFAAVRARSSEDSNSESAMRAPLSVLPAASFEDAELHAKILDLAVDRAGDSIEDRWTDPTVVLIECLLMSCHLPKQSARYTGQVADEMMALLSTRGEERKILAKQVGRMIRDLGFETEPRDKHGVKLLLSETVRKKITNSLTISRSHRLRTYSRAARNVNSEERKGNESLCCAKSMRILKYEIHGVDGVANVRDVERCKRLSELVDSVTITERGSKTTSGECRNCRSEAGEK